MDLYVRLWPVWLLLAILAVNLFVALVGAFMKAGDDKIPANPLNVTALITAYVMALAAVVNVVICILHTFLRQ